MAVQRHSASGASSRAPLSSMSTTAASFKTSRAFWRSPSEQAFQSDETICMGGCKGAGGKSEILEKQFLRRSSRKSLCKKKSKPWQNPRSIL
jgi:hypothetical protein